MGLADEFRQKKERIKNELSPKFDRMVEVLNEALVQKPDLDNYTFEGSEYHSKWDFPADELDYFVKRFKSEGFEVEMIRGYYGTDIILSW